MGDKLDYQLIPVFLNILEGVVKLDGPWALELGFYTEATRRCHVFLTLWWTMRNSTFAGWLFIQRKLFWYVPSFLDVDQQGDTFCWSYEIILSCLWRAAERAYRRLIVTTSSGIFEPPLLQPLPVVMWCAAKAVWQNALNNIKLFMWRWLSQVQPSKCAII